MNILTSPKFQELKTARELPSSRGVVRHIMRIAQNEQVTAKEIARVVKADPALAARVMKAANAVPLADRRPVIAMPDAVDVLGVRVVRQVALGFSLLSSYSDGACAGFDHDGYWQRSLATAIAFSAVAGRLQAAPPEEAFVTGLLSRIGTLALATIYPREYEAVLDHAQKAPERLVTFEREAFATDHNELCAALLGEWGMPRPLVEGVFHHECPGESRLVDGSRAQVTASALHYARMLGEWCVARGDEQTDRGASLHDAARQIGISDEVQIALLSEVASEWHQARDVLVDRNDIRNHPEAEADIDGPIIVSPPLASTGLKLLVADDDPAIVQYLRRVLTSQGHEVFTASNGLKALELALSKTPHIVITDWVMPEMDGVSLCRALRQTAVGRGIYVLVMTDSQDVGRLVEAFDAGADDFVRKPVSPKVLTARLRAAQRVLKLHADFERDREEMRRVTAELAIENRRYQQAALTDALTGFPNRRYAIERLEQEWETARRAERAFSCLLIDVDHFKAVNDVHGHDAGDRVLKHIAQVLRDTARAHDFIGRIGGEEFLVLCPNTGAAGAQACAERLRAAVEAAQFTVGKRVIGLTVSIGVAVWTKDFASPDALVKAADVAVYAAKDSGRNCVSYTSASAADAAPDPAASFTQSSLPLAASAS